MLDLRNIRLIAPYSVEGVKNANLTELEKWISKHGVVGIDCETTGLDVFTDEIVMFQIGGANRQYVIDTRFVSIKHLGEMLANKTIVGQNLKFDFKHVKYHFGWTLLWAYDIMLVEKVLNCNHENEDIKGFYSLANMAERYLKAEFSPLLINKNGKKIVSEQLSLFPELSFSKAVRLEFNKIGHTPFTLRQIVYGANDIWMPFLIKRRQTKRIQNDDLKKAVDIENKFLPVLVDMELKGIYYDKTLAESNTKLYRDKVEEYDKKLRKVKDINWNSSPQATKVLKEFGVPTQVLDKIKSYGDVKIYKDSVGKAHLSKYKKKWDIVETYLEYKQLRKLVDSYGDKFLTNINSKTDRIHSEYFQMLATGRSASLKPNLQNIPSKGYPGFRECFIAPEGKDIIVSDYSGQESRILADQANERVMTDFFLNGDGDMHSLTARRMFDIPQEEAVPNLKRQQGKITGFTIAYGGGADKIADTFQITKSEANELVTGYDKAYPGLSPYFKKRHEYSKRYGYMVTNSYSRRRIYLKDYTTYKELDSYIAYLKRRNWTSIIPKKVWSTYYKIKGNIERNSQNYPIQSTGADQTKMAATMFLHWTISKKIDAYIVNLVHDEIVVECAKKYSQRVSKQLKKFMEDAGNLVMEHKNIPIIANPVISNYWTH